MSKHRDARRRARSTWLLIQLKSIAVAWVWIAGRPLGPQPRSNAWTALHHPFTICPLCCLGQGEKQFLPCYSLKNTVLFTSVQAVISLRLSEGISDSLSVQPLAC